MTDPDSHHWAEQFLMLGREDLAHTCTIVSESLCRSLGHLDATDLRRITNPVLWACANPVHTDQIMQHAQQIWGPGNFFVLDWDGSRSPLPDRVYWPCFFLEQRRNPRSAVRARRYRISMLCGRVRRHRLYLWRQVRDLVRSDDVVVVNAFGRDLSGLDPDDLRDLPWANHKVFLDQPPTQEVASNTMCISHEAFLACVNITAETMGVTPGLFVTEKTWKSVMAGCMPWHWGCSGVAQYLRDLGLHDWFGEPPDAMAAARSLFLRGDIFDFYHGNLLGIQQDVDLFWSADLQQRLTHGALAALESWLAR